MTLEVGVVKPIRIDNEFCIVECPNEYCNGLIFPIRNAMKNFTFSGEGKCIKCGIEVKLLIDKGTRYKHKRSHRKIEAAMKLNRH